MLGSTVLCGCESWMMNKNVQMTLRRWERNMIRRIVRRRTTENMLRDQTSKFTVFIVIQ